MYNLYVYRRSLHRALDKYLIGFLLSHQLCSYKSFFNVGQRVLQVCGQHSPLRPLRRHPSTYPQRMQPVLYQILRREFVLKSFRFDLDDLIDTNKPLLYFHIQLQPIHQHIDKKIKYVSYFVQISLFAKLILMTENIYRASLGYDRENLQHEYVCIYITSVLKLKQFWNFLLEKYQALKTLHVFLTTFT